MVSKPLAILWLLFSLIAVCRGQISCFTGSFDHTNPPSPTVISLLPAARQGVYSASDTITVSNTTGAALIIWKVSDCSLVYSGASPKVFSSNTLTAGAYAVQATTGAMTDRSTFGVLANNIFTNKTDMITSEGVTSPDNATNRLAVINPHMVRFHQNARINLVEPTFGVTNWNSMDTVMSSYNSIATNFTKQVTLVYPKTDWMTNDVNQYLTAVSNHVSRFLTRYGHPTNKIDTIEVLNEPYSDKVPPFAPVNDDWNSNTLYKAYVTAKWIRDQLAPQVKLIGPNYSTWKSYVNGHMERLTNNIGLGTTAGAAIDVKAWHEYREREPIDEDWSSSNSYHTAQTQVDMMRSTFGSNTVLALSEVGWFMSDELGITNSATSNVGWRSGTDRAIKQLLFWRHVGAYLFNIHSFEGDASTGTLQAHDIYGWNYNKRGPKCRTLETLSSMRYLSGYSPSTRTNVNNVWFLNFTNATTTLTAAYCREGITTNLVGTQLLDVYGVPVGGPLGSEPRFFIVAEEAAPPAPTAWWGPVSP